VPLSKEDRSFSFGNELDLSLSGDAKTPTAAAEETKSGGTSPPADLERTSSLRKGPPRLSKGSVHFNPDHINIGLPYDSARPVSGATYSSSSSLPYAESSKSVPPPPVPQDQGDSPEEPSDYDIFLQKSKDEFQRDKQRNWPTVEIEDASFTNLPAANSKNMDRRKLFAMGRKILRILQVFTRCHHIQG
jgi:hypothetical protein